MKFAARMNSFLSQGGYNLFETIDVLKNMKEITHLEFNYPEHFSDHSPEEVKAYIGDMKVNGVATRFRSQFIAGEFTNPDEEINKQAIELCKEAVDTCKLLGGSVVTVWLGYDGFDYSFQMDYEKKWNQIIKSFQIVSDYAPDIKISIEYKPFEPRSFSMIDSIGTTMLALKEIDRPNVGVTLDYCHMLMKYENPAYSLSLAAKDGKLFGVHLNDGNRAMDDGLIFGTTTLVQALETVYFMKKYKYDGVIFFDTFPFREDSVKQTQANIDMYKALSKMIDNVSMNRIEEIVSKQDGVEAQRLLLELVSK